MKVMPITLACAMLLAGCNSKPPQDETPTAQVTPTAASTKSPTRWEEVDPPLTEANERGRAKLRELNQPKENR